MSPQLSTATIVKVDTLAAVARVRLEEARVLHRAGKYAGAVYLAGYAVECELKVAICRTLRWSELRRTFMTHDLESLLLHSGFDGELRKDVEMSKTFANISAIWRLEGRDNVRYVTPATFAEGDARRFLAWVAGPKKGFVPWLRRKASKKHN